jgi:hypothetical protein
MKTENLKFIGLFFGVIILIAVLFYRMGYHEGYNYGAGLGVHASLDTVKSIMDKQLKSDTSYTKLILINPDTNVYVLSRKTILKD